MDLTLAAQVGALLIALSGLALILQQRRLAGPLFLAGVAAVMLLPFAPYAPVWIIAIIAVWLGLALLRALLNASVGRNAASGALSILAADVVRFVFLTPFRILGGLIGLLLRREPPQPAVNERRRR